MTPPDPSPESRRLDVDDIVGIDKLSIVVETPDGALAKLIEEQADVTTKSAIEQQIHEGALSKARLARFELETHGRRQDILARKTYGVLVYTLLVGWLCLLFGLLAWAGLGVLKLSDSVLIALISGTTANILGIFAIVILYLFPKERPPQG